MKRLTISMIPLLLFLSGCAFPVYKAPVMPPQIGLITNIKVPMTTNYQNTSVGIKSGTASNTYYLRDPIFTNISICWGNSSLDKAARNGNLKEVYYADYKYLNILGIFGKFNIEAYGK